MLAAEIEIERAPVVTDEELCKSVDEIFRNMPLLRAVVVVDNEMKPVGLIPRSDFLLQLSQRFGRALYENRPVASLMQAEPLIVPVNEPFEDFVRAQFLTGEHEVQDIFVLTDDEGHYRGISNGRAVMKALLDAQKILLADLSSSREQLVIANEQLGQEVSVRRAAEREAINASHRDPLTGLFNRAPMVRNIDELIEDEAPFALIFIDLDGFKTLNDVYGHLAGDEALRTVARRLGELEEGVTCARFGGDEFAVILPKSSSAEAPEIYARKLHGAITESFEFDGRYLRIGASLGLALYPDNATLSNDLLQAADMAMLRAKREGGGLRKYDRSVDAGSTSRRAQLQALTAAVGEQEIEPYFQPIVDLTTRRPIVHEVLARWPSGGDPLGRPDNFIALAEREGLIDDLFWLVFAKACNGVRRAEVRTRLAFNVSARQLHNASLPERLLREIDRQGLRPEDIEVEVTETAMIANEKLAAAALRKLRQAGVQIALDDFGTGFSSLALLHKFPFDSLKIDHSFVSRMTSERRSLDIVASTLLMAERLGLKTVAEGVEDQATLDCLGEIGCNMVQGYYLGRPAPTLQQTASGTQKICQVA